MGLNKKVPKYMRNKKTEIKIGKALTSSLIIKICPIIIAANKIVIAVVTPIAVLSKEVLKVIPEN